MLATKRARHANAPQRQPRVPRLDVHVVQRLRERAASLGLYTDAAIARRAGIAAPDLSPVFNRKRGVSLRILTGLARALEGTVDEVLSGVFVSASDARRSPANDPVALARTEGYLTVRVYAEASAGRGSGARLNELVNVPVADAGNRALIAVRIRGTCMQAAGILPGDTVLFEKVPDDEVQDGEMVCVTLLDEHEDGAYLVKYLQWARNGEDKVILTAEDGTRIEAPYDRVIIEGRYWDLRRPRNR